MALVGLNDEFEYYWPRSDSMRMFTEQIWASYFDLVANANRIARADENLKDLILTGMSASPEDQQKAPMLASFAATLQQYGDPQAARQVFVEALRFAMWAGQPAVIRVCTRCLNLLTAQEKNGFLLRLNDELFQ
jgi:hypothetical protein